MKNYKYKNDQSGLFYKSHFTNTCSNIHHMWMISNKIKHTHIQNKRDRERDNERKDFYVVNLRRGNIHGLNLQPPAKQSTIWKSTYTLKGINTMISTSSYHFLIYHRASEPLSLLLIQGMSYTFRKQLPIQGSQASRKIPLLSNLDHKDPSQAPLAQLSGVPNSLLRLLLGYPELIPCQVFLLKWKLHSL